MAGYRYEWNEAKRVANLAKHGLDFADVDRFGWGDAISVPDARRACGELRFRAFGLLDGRACVVVFTRRGQVNRIISFRPANARERRRHGF